MNRILAAVALALALGTVAAHADTPHETTLKSIPDRAAFERVVFETMRKATALNDPDAIYTVCHPANEDQQFPAYCETAYELSDASDKLEADIDVEFVRQGGKDLGGPSAQRQWRLLVLTREWSPDLIRRELQSSQTSAPPRLVQRWRLIMPTAAYPPRIRSSKRLLAISATTFLLLGIWLGPDRAVFMIAVAAIVAGWVALCRRFPLVAIFTLGLFRGLVRGLFSRR